MAETETATIKLAAGFSGLGTLAPLSRSFDISYNEANRHLAEIALSAGGDTTITVFVTNLTTVLGLLVEAITASTTLTEGIAIDLLGGTGASFVKHAELINGQSGFFVPPGTAVTIRNLSTDTDAVVEYTVFGT